jgi:chromosome segregation ATPase
MQLNYHKEFLKSPEHLWTAVGTIGGGLAVGNIIGLLVGVAAYAISWIYLPDLAFFRKKVEAKAEALTQREEEAKANDFRARRDAMRGALQDESQSRYNELAAVCQEIETGGTGNDPLFGKLDELMWTFLKLLTMEEAIGRFLKESQGEDLDAQIAEAQAEVDKLGGEKPAAGSSRGKLFDSRQQIVEVLRKRKEAITGAEDNLGLVRSEEERLGHQIRLLRAEAVATRNSDMLTVKINSSVATLQDTNALLSQMSSYQEMVADMPQTTSRIGYGEVTDAPLPLPRRRALRN